MKREPAPEIVAQFRREADKGDEDESERRAYLEPSWPSRCTWPVVAFAEPTSRWVEPLEG